MSGKCYIGVDLQAPTTIQETCDVCIIGSGAGGAVLAAGLVERGLKVIMIEEGGYYTKDDFDLNEAHAFDKLYQDRGLRATAELGISILQGRSVGGGTTVNWTTCFRTPDRILKHWERVHGIEGLDSETLRPHFESVEKRLGIAEWPYAAANANNKVILDGCLALGWDVEPLKRNVRGCANSGYCGMGCPVGAKQSMHRTYIQDALEAGLSLYSDTKVQHIETKDNRVVAIHARVLDRESGKEAGAKLVVKPKVAVSSCGAINGPALLLRSGINPNGRVGKRTMLHPVVGLPGIYDKPIRGFYGAPQSISSHQFVDRGEDKAGFFIETSPVHPVIGTFAFSGFGAAQRDFMGTLAHNAVVLGLTIDGLLPEDDGGTVSLRGDGRIHVDYPIRPFMEEAFLEAHLRIAELHLAAGAREMRTLHTEPLFIRSKDDIDKLRDKPYGLLKHPIFTAHQMGGCAMGPDANTSVVGPNHQHHHIPNLFVVDGSVFPTSLGVNPSQTIYGMAHRARDFVAEAV